MRHRPDAGQRAAPIRAGNKGLLNRLCQQQSYVDEREMRWESVMGSYLRDASSTRNKAQESILEPNLSLVHAFYEFLLFFYVQI